MPEVEKQLAPEKGQALPPLILLLHRLLPILQNYTGTVIRLDDPTISYDLPEN